MLTLIQPTPPMLIDGATAQPTKEAEAITTPTFGEILKVEELKLQKEIQSNAIAAILATMLTPVPDAPHTPETPLNQSDSQTTASTSFQTDQSHWHTTTPNELQTNIASLTTLNFDPAEKLTEIAQHKVVEQAVEIAQPKIREQVVEIAQPKVVEQVVEIAQPKIREQAVEITQPKIVEQVVEIAQPKVVEQVVEIAQPKVVEQVAEIAQPKVVEQVVEIAQPKIREQAVEITQPKVVEQVVEISQPKVVEQAVEIAQPKVVEQVVEITQPKVVEQVVEIAQPKVVEQVVEIAQPKVVEQVVEITQPKVVEQAVEIAQPKVVEQVVEITQPKVVEQVVEIAQPKVVEQVVEITQPKVVEQVVEIAKPKIREQVVEIAQPKIREQAVEITQPKVVDQVVEMPESTEWVEASVKENLTETQKLLAVKKEAFVVDQIKVEDEQKADKVDSTFELEFLSKKNEGVLAPRVEKNNIETLREAKSTFKVLPDVVEQISQQVSPLLTRGEQSVRMVLNPRELGEIEVQVTQTSAGVSISFTAEQVGTSQLLERQSGELRQALRDAGVQVSQLNVGSQGQQSYSEGGGFRQSLGFRSAPQQEAGDEPKKGSGTSVRLNAHMGEIDYLV